MPAFSPHARGCEPSFSVNEDGNWVFPARAGLRINVASLLLAAQIISTQFHGAHTSQARASFPNRSLLRSTCRVGTPASLK